MTTTLTKRERAIRWAKAHAKAFGAAVGTAAAALAIESVQALVADPGTAGHVSDLLGAQFAWATPAILAAASFFATKYAPRNQYTAPSAEPVADTGIEVDEPEYQPEPVDPFAGITAALHAGE